MTSERAPVLIGFAIGFSLLAIVTGDVAFWGAWFFVAVVAVMALTPRAGAAAPDQKGSVRDWVFTIIYGCLGLAFAVYLFHEVKKLPH